MQNYVKDKNSSLCSDETLTSEGNMRKLHIFLDCDPGSDDFFLLAMLLILFKNNKSRINIIGLSASYGNSSVNHTLANLTSLVSILGMASYEISIYKGAEAPLIPNEQFYTPLSIHGGNGLADVQEIDKPNLSLSKGKITAKELLRLFEGIKEKEETKDDKIIFMSTGPFTLIAELIMDRPKIKTLIDKFIVMGGTFENEGGNCNSLMTAEFNIFSDPNAANTVFTDPIMKKKSIIFPLNITHKAILDKNQILRFSESSRKDKQITAVKKAFLKLIHKFTELYSSSEDNIQHKFDSGPPMHDVLTIMPIIDYLLESNNANNTEWSFKEIDFMVEIEGERIGETHIFNSDLKLKSLNDSKYQATSYLLDYKQTYCLVLYDMNFNIFWDHFQNTFEQIDQEIYKDNKI